MIKIQSLVLLNVHRCHIVCTSILWGYQLSKSQSKLFATSCLTEHGFYSPWSKGAFCPNFPAGFAWIWEKSMNIWGGGGIIDDSRFGITYLKQPHTKKGSHDHFTPSSAKIPLTTRFILPNPYSPESCQGSKENSVRGIHDLRCTHVQTKPREEVLGLFAYRSATTFRARSMACRTNLERREI